MEKVAGHTRLYRRESGTYYHRAVVPRDIRSTYVKREEKFSLNTKDYGEALRLVRLAAVEVDQRFEKHRHWLATQHSAPLDELTPDQIKLIENAYLHYLLDEDDEVRLEGFKEEEDRSAKFEGLSIFEAVDEALKDTRDTFEERSDTVDAMLSVTRNAYARGRQDVFLRNDAEEVLSWGGIGIRLAEGPPSWPSVIRATAVPAGSRDGSTRWAWRPR